MDTIGARIKRARLDAGYENQVDFAAQIGVDRASVSQWETNETVPRTDRMIKIAVLTGKSMDWLCCLRDKEPSKEAVEVQDKWDDLPLNARTGLKGTIDAFTPTPTPKKTA